MDCVVAGEGVKIPYVFERSGEAAKAVTRRGALPAGHMQAQGLAYKRHPSKSPLEFLANRLLPPHFKTKQHYTSHTEMYPLTHPLFMISYFCDVPKLLQPLPSHNHHRNTTHVPRPPKQSPQNRTPLILNQDITRRVPNLGQRI
jgi:hypothetical protein